jgi:hypothetical protein
MTKVFNRNDVGCWIDGAHGEQHANQVLANTVRHLPNVGDWAIDDFHDFIEVIENAHAKDYLDDSLPDCIDYAIELMQNNTADGLIWLWESGDLILTTEDQID